MRPAFWAVVFSASLVSAAYSQDLHKSSDWQKMYQDASNQLRAAQNRKSELAAENAKLAARLAETEKKLQATQAQIEQLHFDALTFGDQTLMLRSFYADWQLFVSLTPALRGRWDAFLGQNIPGLPDDPVLLCDPQWPLELN
jgi:DNA repair exonuclease SbcCD ATPase subunit